MKIYVEPWNYEPWLEAIDTYNELQDCGLLNAFFDELELYYPKGIDITALNDLLRFDPELCYKLVGLKYDSKNGEIID